MEKKCPHCFAKLDKDGYCSRPCRLGAIKKREAEIKKKKEQS